MTRCWLALVLAPALALADPKLEAQAHVDRATQLHGENNLAEASSELAIAYALDPRPELLFAIGQVHVKLGHCGLAIAFYTRFLATNPDDAAGAYEAIETCKKTDKPLEPKAEAKRLVDVATAFHEAGQYDLARGELAMAYALDPQPPLLFAIGQLDVKLDRCDAAISFYERFVATRPAGGTDEATEAIEVCRARLAKPAPPVAPPTPPPPKPEAPPPPPAAARAWYRDPLGLGLAGGGLACAIAGGVFYLQALGALDDAEAAPTYDQHTAFVDDAHGKRRFAAILGGGAVALTGVAVYRFLRVHRDGEAHVAIVPSHDGAAITFGGRF